MLKIIKRQNDRIGGLDMHRLEEKIGYQFKDKQLIETALTHSSYANESHNGPCNERLEFLGDAVLSIIISEHIYKLYANKQEGDLTKLRSSLVCETTLADFARSIGLGDYIKLGNGERRSGGAERPSILSDAFEALIAAIFLDGGIESAAQFVLPFAKKAMRNPESRKIIDYKTVLQEIVQQSDGEKLVYVLVSESGPDHDKHFVTEVHLNSNVIGKGGGRSKKEAEQQAAKAALALMGYRGSDLK